jgi:aspartate/methionine/tyrosine aminotransferase
MTSVHDFCANRGVQLIADQVYHPIYHGPPAGSAAALTHATVLGDFSKALCLSGLRIGWIVERDAHRRAQYLNARSYFTVSNNVLGERLATLALQRSSAIYGRAQRIAQANLSLLDTFFAEHRDLLDWVRPRGGMTAFPWFRNGHDTRELCEQLVECGVLVAPGDCFGMPSHFRLGFAASAERFPRALERLSEFFSSPTLQAPAGAASEMP